MKLNLEASRETVVTQEKKIEEPQLYLSVSRVIPLHMAWSNHKDNLRRKEKMCFVAVVPSCQVPFGS